MCGIFSIINHNNKHEYSRLVNYNFKRGSARGPEYSKLTTFQEEKDSNIILGFHRLAINGLNKDSHQPLVYKGCRLICNGEIYNYRELYESIGVVPQTGSDCEVIIHYYKKYGIKQTLSRLRGVYAFVLVDEVSGFTYVARDIYGVRPLFIADMMENNNSSICFASEMKMLHLLTQNIRQVQPGSFYSFSRENGNNIWKQVGHDIFYNKDVFVPIYNNNYNKQKALELIRDSLTEAVQVRVETTDRPIACLLSGGLDSSLITSLVKKCLGENQVLETYSIGFEGSEDLKYARKVANFLKTDHHEIVVQEEDFLNEIPNVISLIESYDTTTVRASVGNYLVAKYISQHSKAKVIFNGDGSDEVTGGYLYFHESPSMEEFHEECLRLLKDIHYFDVLRSDRSISGNGLEARTPFLDEVFVRNYLTLPIELRCHPINNQCEKYLLREAFRGYLPEEVLFRTKEAFSDGVSKQTRSWYEIIQEYVETQKDQIVHETRLYNTPTTNEQLYYRSLFEKSYKYSENVIPYFWMPRFVDATDASARTLKFYKEKIENDNNEETEKKQETELSQ